MLEVCGSCHIREYMGTGDYGVAVVICGEFAGPDASIWFYAGLYEGVCGYFMARTCGEVEVEHA